MMLFSTNCDSSCIYSCRDRISTEIGGRNTKHWLLQQALPSLFPYAFFFSLERLTLGNSEMTYLHLFQTIITYS